MIQCSLVIAKITESSFNDKNYKLVLSVVYGITRYTKLLLVIMNLIYEIKTTTHYTYVFRKAIK